MASFRFTSGFDRCKFFLRGRLLETWGSVCAVGRGVNGAGGAGGRGNNILLVSALFRSNIVGIELLHPESRATRTALFTIE